MAIFYAYILDQRLYGHPLVKGLLYGTAVWLFNAFVVLPLTGEGIAGSGHLNAIGMISFAIAHMAFFEVLSVLYGCLLFRVSSAAAGRSSCLIDQSNLTNS